MSTSLLLSTPTPAVAGKVFFYLDLFVSCLFPHDISNFYGANMTKLDIEMFHD